MAYPPLDDAERVARHYGVSIDEACEMLATKSIDELVPARGTGLTTGRARTGNPNSNGDAAPPTTVMGIPLSWIVIGIIAYFVLRR